MYFNKIQKLLYRKKSKKIYDLLHDSISYFYLKLQDTTLLNDLKKDENKIILFTNVTFFYHMFFYRMILTKKYNKKQIDIIIDNCFDFFIDSFKEIKPQKKEFINISQTLFADLESFICCILDQSINQKNKDQATLNIGKYYISIIEQCNISDIIDLDLSLLISNYYLTIITDKNLITEVLI